MNKFRVFTRCRLLFWVMVVSVYLVVIAILFLIGMGLRLMVVIMGVCFLTVSLVWLVVMKCRLLRLMMIRAQNALKKVCITVNQMA